MPPPFLRFCEKNEKTQAGMDSRKCQTATATPAVGYQTDGLDSKGRRKRALLLERAGDLLTL